jgi:hypothetical protein
MVAAWRGSEISFSSCPACTPATIMPIFRLRRLAVRLAAEGDDDSIWFASAVRVYEAGAAEGLSFDAALGLVPSPGKRVWWNIERRARRDHPRNCRTIFPGAPNSSEGAADRRKAGPLPKRLPGGLIAHGGPGRWPRGQNRCVALLSAETRPGRHRHGLSNACSGARHKLCDFRGTSSVGSPMPEVSQNV